MRNILNKTNKKLIKAFTVLELIIVIVIIGILSTVVYISYDGVQARAHDVSVLSDLDTLDALETSYVLNNGNALAYYSNDGARIEGLDFSPSDNNVIDIVTDGDAYCIRGYNTLGSKNSIFNAFTKESNDGICDSLNASDVVMSDYYSEAFPNGLWSQVDTNYHHVCALNLDGKAYCWGFNESGQLGNGTTDESLIPTAVDMSDVLHGKTLRYIASGYDHTCAIASDDLVYCWGETIALGTGNTTWYTIPAAVYTSGALNGKTVKSLAVGSFSNCAIASDDLAYCWGANSDGQLGDNSTISRLEPTPLYMLGYLSGKTIKEVSLSEYHGCAIASDDLAYCWGWNYYGQLGNNSTSDSIVPVPVYTAGNLSGKTIKSIITNSYDDGYTCAIASDDLAYCWGWNYYGQLGNNSTSDSIVPVPVYTAGNLSGKTIKSLSVGEHHTCAIASDDLAYCWGNNSNGQLGNNSTTQSNVPVPVNMSGVLSGKTIKSITAGASSTCALASDNQLYCWGRNLYGELGNGSNTGSLVPKFVYPY